MTEKFERVLYVEDQPHIQTLVRIALEKIGGFTVRICSSGKEAVAVAPEFRPQLILLDVMMPVWDGPTTLKMFRELPEFATTPAVFITAKVQQSEIDRYLSLGAAGVIAKPFNTMTLSSQLQAIWDKTRA